MTIFIPTPLRSYVGGRDTVDVAAATVSDALNGLTETHPELRKHLFTGEGKLRAFVNLYLNDEDVRYLPAKEATAVAANRHAHDHPLDRRGLAAPVSTN